MQRRTFLKTAGQLAASGTVARIAAARDSRLRASSAGLLRVHPRNGRYFQDHNGRAVLLVGSHTWNSLVDMGREDPPEAFDFEGYLGFLERHGHNFIRLWAWDSVTWETRANRGLGKDFVHHVAPQPWRRVGTEKALDGKPKFDLEQFDTRYFDRLRTRVRLAGERGIHVSVMLFEGWGLMHGNQGRAAPAGWAWRGHPFHPANNLNGIDAGTDSEANQGRVHQLGHPKLNVIQAGYIRRVVDTVNEFPHVLYEVINEGGQKEWDWWVVETIRSHERGKPLQHPIGITGHGAEDLASMLASPADWISPGGRDGFKDNPPAWDGKKVSILDTDHVWGVGGNQAWVWKSLMRGHNPIFMDPYDGSVLGNRFDALWDGIRRSMGFARQLSERVDLAAMTPQDQLSSTGFCLASPGSEYLVYLPSAGTATVTLNDVKGELAAEWLDCSTGQYRPGAKVDGGGPRELTSPVAADAVLYLRRMS